MISFQRSSLNRNVYRTYGSLLFRWSFKHRRYFQAPVICWEILLNVSSSLNWQRRKGGVSFVVPSWRRNNCRSDRTSNRDVIDRLCMRMDLIKHACWLAQIWSEYIIQFIKFAIILKLQERRFKSYLLLRLLFFQLEHMAKKNKRDEQCAIATLAYVVSALYFVCVTLLL